MPRPPKHDRPKPPRKNSESPHILPFPVADEPTIANVRLDKLVADRFGLSRRQSQDAILNGKVDLNGERADEPGLLVEPDAPIRYLPARPKARTVRTRLNILFDDRHLIVVDKPAGLLTIPTPARERDTLIERVSRYLAIRYGGRRPYLGVVHRLDKDTSGALVFARTNPAQRGLQALFKTHDIDREYLAIVEGDLARSAGTIDLPLVADRGDLRRGVSREPGEGRRAITHYEVVERFAGVATLVACRLETGRTHQIRIHMAALGHPVVGDSVYRPRSMKRPRVRHTRQALHARTLGFVHPMTGESLRLEVEPPPDFQKLLRDLRDRPGGFDLIEEYDS